MAGCRKEIMLAGLGIVLIFSFASGFQIFGQMLSHLRADLTDDLGVHLYIAGLALLAFDLYGLARK